MKNETLSKNQMIAVMILFIFGSSVVIGINTHAMQDSWIVLILAALFAAPLILLYSRIIKLFPGRDIFDISNELFGKIKGGIITALLIWYALHLGAMILRNFSGYIEITAMPETPELPLMAGLLLLTAYLVKCGLETMGSFSFLALLLILLVLFFTLLLALETMDMQNFLPIDHDILFMADKATISTAFPFGETVLFLAIASAFYKKESPYKIYFHGFLFGFAVLLIIVLRNTAVLGPHIMKSSYYPSHTAAGILQAGEFLQRIESTITYNFMLAGTVKTAVCLFAASKGISKLFGIKDYKSIILPTAFLMLGISTFSFSSAFEMAYFPETHRFYVIPFQLIIPVMIWIAAELKSRRKTPS